MATSPSKTAPIASAPLTPPPGVNYVTFYTQQGRAKLATNPPTKPSSARQARVHLAEQEDMNRRLDRCIQSSQQLIDECRAVLRKPADAAYSSQEYETSLELMELREARPVALQLARLALDGALQTMQRTTEWVLVTPPTVDCDNEPSTDITSEHSTADVATKDSNSQARKHVAAGTPAGVHNPCSSSRTKERASSTTHRKWAVRAMARHGTCKSLFSFEVCWKW